MHKFPGKKKIEEGGRGFIMRSTFYYNSQMNRQRCNNQDVATKLASSLDKRKSVSNEILNRFEKVIKQNKLNKQKSA